MAIDSEEKRKSVVGVVTPNTNKDADWRRQVAGLYSFGDADVAASFDDLSDLDGLFIINSPPSDSVGGGGGEVMPGPPVTWNEANPVRNYDWSFFTVAVDGGAQVRYSGRGATLVSPSYAVCAHHARGSGTFYWVPYAGGAEVSRTSTMTEGVDYWNIDGDLGLIKLSSPITTIDPIRIFTDCSVAAGNQCVAIELDRHLNRMVVDPTLTNSDANATINRTSGAADALEGGDSGKPAVCFVNGVPVLVITAIETGGASSGAGPNASHYIDDIQAILDADAEELTLWNIVEGGEGSAAQSSSIKPTISNAFSPTSVPLVLLGA